MVAVVVVDAVAVAVAVGVTFSWAQQMWSSQYDLTKYLSVRWNLSLPSSNMSVWESLVVVFHFYCLLLLYICLSIVYVQFFFISVLYALAHTLSLRFIEIKVPFSLHHMCYNDNTITIFYLSTIRSSIAVFLRCYRSRVDWYWHLKDQLKKFT